MAALAPSVNGVVANKRTLTSSRNRYASGKLYFVSFRLDGRSDDSAPSRSKLAEACQAADCVRAARGQLDAPFKLSRASGAPIMVAVQKRLKKWRCVLPSCTVAKEVLFLAATLDVLLVVVRNLPLNDDD